MLQRIKDNQAAKMGLPPKRHRTQEQVREWKRMANERYYARKLGLDLNKYPPYIRKPNK